MRNRTAFNLFQGIFHLYFQYFLLTWRFSLTGIIDKIKKKEFLLQGSCLCGF